VASKSYFQKEQTAYRTTCSINSDGMYVGIVFSQRKRWRFRLKMITGQSDLRPENREIFSKSQFPSKVSKNVGFLTL
jgi:hypothetical protein